MAAPVAAGEVPSDKLHVLFFPLMGPGDFIPMVDMARHFAARGVRSTIVTTPANTAAAAVALDSSTAVGHPIHLVTIPFPPPEDTGLPAGAENIASVPTSAFMAFVSALWRFQAPFESILRELRPDAIISDSLFPWTADLALAYNIPRLVFHGAGAFPTYVLTQLRRYFPLQDSFIMEGLPDKIKIYKAGLPEIFNDMHMVQMLAAAQVKSYGVVMNTYRGMEPTYVDAWKNQRGTLWCVGPVSLCARAAGGGGDEVAHRGGPPAAGKERILSWLDSKPPGSVVYVCFGSLCDLGSVQLKEIALGLEKSGVNFLWVVRTGTAAEWLPEGYEQRVGGRGMVVKGWAPQLLVLGHVAVGWFVTHCGWNSLQEAAVAGVPMVTWPLFHEQFINQELLVDVMRIGVRMWENGLRRWPFGEAATSGEAIVSCDEVAAVLQKVMAGGEEVEGMKKRAKEYAIEAKKAVAEGGSSLEDIADLIEELKARRKEGFVKADAAYSNPSFRLFTQNLQAS